jgi:transcriptional regulator with XRE-family HTH domain
MNSDSNYLVHKIGPKLRAYRKQKNIRLMELSKATSISSAMISKIENGRIIPTLPRLLNIIHFLGITPEDFFSRINGESEAYNYLHVKRSEYQSYIKEESAEGFHYESILEKTIDGYAFQISFVTLKSGNKRPKSNYSSLRVSVYSGRRS